MNYQRVFIGLAIGSAVAGIAFLAFHPNGKKIGRKIADIGLDAADKMIDVLRTVTPEPEERDVHASQPVSQV